MPALLLACTAPSSPARERQYHGLVFEEWVRDTFFDGYKPPGYTQKWDIPAAANKSHGRIPVNPKTAKFGGPVDLGDALRQFDIDEPFWLVIGYWEPDGDGRKMANITAIRVKPSAWRKLWGEISRADIEKFDALIKDRSLSLKEVRRRAMALKAAAPFSEAVMQLNPKIDWNGQRRLQCSLSLEAVCRHLAPRVDFGRHEAPALWGVRFPGWGG